MKTALITLSLILAHFASYGESQFSKLYDQDIVGSPEIEKIEVWKNSQGEPSQYVILSLKLRYETFDSCQEAIGLQDSVKTRGRKGSNDYLLLMGSRRGFCMTSIGSEIGSFTLPNPVRIGSSFKISGREFSLERHQGQILINEIN